MPKPHDILERNREWESSIKAHIPDYFRKLFENKSPDYLWIGCSDSRIQCSEMLGLLPGEHMVHRNIANLVVHTDLNCLSVIQYSVEILKVKHIIVCGHYDCAGVGAALYDKKLGLVDNWVNHVRDVRNKHQALLATIDDEDRRYERLCELNVIEQVVNVCRTSTVQSAWKGKRDLTVHGWIYDISEGLLHDLTMRPSKETELSEMYKAAVRLYL